MFNRIRTLLGIFAGVPFALLYGAFARLIFVHNSEAMTTVSLAFMGFVPIAVGALTVVAASPHLRGKALYVICVPWLSMLIGMVIAGALAIEFNICLAMALPIVFPMASFGGIAVWALGKGMRKAQPQVIGALMLLPFVVGPVENRIPIADSYHTVSTQIEIHASEPVIWQNIIRVLPIQPSERHFSLLFDVFGAPRPLEAQLASDGAGAMRRGLFDGGLAFSEKITAWEPNRRLDFEITAENHLAMHPEVSFAPWSEIGGAAFAVPQASYVLEPLGNGDVMLHLSSTHRLSTRFNDYGSLWTDWGMSEFQNQILQVVKARAEAAR